jgi:hypothetical protein
LKKTFENGTVRLQIENRVLWLIVPGLNLGVVKDDLGHVFPRFMSAAARGLVLPCRPVRAFGGVAQTPDWKQREENREARKEHRNEQSKKN